MGAVMFRTGAKWETSFPELQDKCPMNMQSDLLAPCTSRRQNIVFKVIR